MDYTRSDAFVTDVVTGHRRHQEDQPVTTAVSADDMNSMIWSLMALVEAAGLSGIAFNAADPDSYGRLKLALETLFASKNWDRSTPYPAGSVGAKLGERFSASDEGATSTGTTPVDDTTAINAIMAAAPKGAAVELDFSRVSVTPAKPSFDANLAAFQSLTWRTGLCINFVGPSGERCTFNDTLSAPYGPYSAGVPVAERIWMAPYHPAYVIDVRTPASFNNVPQNSHQIGAQNGSTTQTAATLGFRKDGQNNVDFSVRDSVPATVSFVGSITAGVLTATGVTGSFAVGQQISTSGAANGSIQGNTVTSFGTGTGGAGTYNVAWPYNVGSQPMTAGINSRRLYNLSYIGGTKINSVQDLSLGFTAINCEKTVMDYPLDVGAIMNISTGSHVRSDITSAFVSGVNGPTLNLQNLTTGFSGFLSVHSSSNLVVLSPGTTVADGTGWLQIGKNAGFICASTTYTAPNASNTIYQIGKNVGTGRSINASGTINASGADYAEYERNNGLSIAKGAVVGFKADGTLTLAFSEAVRFGIKSTDPSYVGGDNWFNEQPPERPEFVPPVYDGPAMPADPGRAASEEEVLAFHEADRAYQVSRSAYLQAAADQLAEFNATEIPLWDAALAAFQVRLEAARVLVDRVAYSGKVPVNVNGATPGQYIVATADAGGRIIGQAVSTPTFEQYRLAIGRVNRILEDGRAEVAVIVH